MSIKHFIARSVLLFFFANPVHAAGVISSTFEVNEDGWIGNPNEGRVEFFPSGGNPGGHIRVTDIGVGVPLGSGAMAPSKFLGDLSGFDNGMLSVDLATFAGSGATFQIFGTVRISGGGDTAFFDLTTTAPPFGTWQTLSAPLTASAWGKTALQWTAILADVTEIAMSTDAFNGNDTIGIDNFAIIPGPQVGGSVTGMGPSTGKVTCRNMTTKKTKTVKITIPAGVRSWDCEQAGLVVNPGDKIKQTITVTGPAD